MPDPIASIINEMTPGAVPTPDPYAQAIAAAKSQYPRFADLPLALSKGKGPGFSETYQPDDDENPMPGKLNVQLRAPEALNNPARWPDMVALEAIHGLYANDPGYQKLTNQFVKTMTPDQLADSRKAYARDQKVFGIDPKKESFDKWLSRVQAQEYIRGGIFTKVIPNWVGPNGEGRYTDQQTQLLGQIKKYLQTPVEK